MLYILAVDDFYSASYCRRFWVKFYLFLLILTVPLTIYAGSGHKLQKGDTIGIVALSNAITDFKEMFKGIMYLHRLGFNIKVAHNVYENEYYFAGSAEERARQLEQFFADPEIKAIMPVRGGYGAIHVLDLIDYDIIKKNPKIFIGYSDLTSLEWALYKHANLATFHGPMVISFTKEEDPRETAESMLSILCEDRQEIAKGFHILYPNCMPQSSEDHHVSQSTEKTELLEPIPDAVEGILVGGNLATFISIMGTSYEIDLNGKILFIEEVNERVMSVDRMLMQMKLASKFDGVKAIVFGYMTSIGQRDPSEHTVYPMIKETLQSLNIPIITGIPSGHSTPMHTLPMGAKVRIDFHEQTIVLVDSLF